MKESFDIGSRPERRQVDSEFVVSNGISRLTIDPQVVESNLLACGLNRETIQNIQKQIMHRLEEIKQTGTNNPQSVGGYAMRFYITKDLMNRPPEETQRYGVGRVELSLIARLISYICREEPLFVPGQYKAGQTLETQ